MQLIHIFISKRRIETYCEDSANLPAPYPLTDADGRPIPVLTGLADLLRQFDGTEPHKISFVLDRTLLSYRYVKLPLTGRGRVVKVLRFELDNIMLYDVDQYHYSYFLRPNREESYTEIGVYTIRREFSDKLLQLCRSFNLEVHWILPLDNLIDVAYKLEKAPDNELHIRIEPDCAKLFVYRNGFLIDCSTVNGPTDAACRNPKERLREFVGSINKRVMALHMADREVGKISVNPECRSLVAVADDLKLESIEGEESEIPLPKTNPQFLLNTYQTNNLQRINLLKTGFPLIKELRKNYGKVVVSSALLAASLIVYLASFGYDMYRNNLTFQRLDREYTDLIGKVLPQGTPKSKAIPTIRQRVRDVRERWNRNKKFGARRYSNITLLHKISLVKNQVPSLHVDKIQSSEKSTAIYGNVTSMQDYDRFLQQIAKTFPPEEFETKNRHKTQGADLITFTTTIRPKENSP